jgi:hypothetical protein
MNVISQIVIKNALQINAIVSSNPGAGSQFNFEYNDTLRDKKIYGFEIIPSTVLERDFNGNVVITGDYPKLTVVLQEQGTNKLIVQQLPYLRFNPQLYNGYTQYINPCKIDWKKSYIQLNAAAAVITAGQSIPAIVYFENNDEK